MSDDEFDFRAWRERMGMTRAEVAEALDVSLSWLQSVEIGRRASNGRLLELACRYIEGHHRAVAAMEDEPSPPAPVVDVSAIMERLSGIELQIKTLMGVPAQLRAQARDVAALKVGQRKLLEAAGLPVPREEAPAVFVSARPSVMLDPSAASTDFGPLPPRMELDPDVDLTEEERDLIARKAAARAAREEEEGE